MHVLEFTGSERAGVPLQPGAWLFRNPLAAFLPVMLLPVIFMIL